MRFVKKIKQEKMLSNNIENQENKENNKVSIVSELSNPQNNIIDSIMIKKRLNSPKKNKESYEANNIKIVNLSSKESFVNNINELKNSIKEKVEPNSSFVEETDNDSVCSNNQQNINGNIDNLFNSDSSLSSVSMYESDDDISEDDTFNHEIIKTSSEITNDISNSEKKTLNGESSLENTEETETNSYFDDSSSITSLSSLGYNDYLSSSTISPIKPKRKLNSEEKEKPEKNEIIKEISDIDTNIPKKKKKRKKKKDKYISPI
jgi:hypothetical protein